MNQTFVEFLQARPTNIGDLIGLNLTQTEEIREALSQPNTIFANQTTRNVLMNQTSDLLQLLEDIGLNQTQT